jgi:lambda repressor-like predicted transcriptional regulator
MSMAISSATDAQVQWQPPAQRPGFDKDMQSVANLLGMSSADLKTAMQGGQSLADLAQSKGVSRADLVSTLETSMKANAPSSVSSTSSTGFAAHLDNIVNHIVDHKGGVGGPGSPGGDRGQATDVSGVDFQANAQQMLTSIANQLQMSPADLLAKLEGGSSLQAIVTQAGTDPAQLLDSLGTGLAVNVLS